MNAVPTPQDFAVGQLWRCRGRSTQEQPTVLINLIEAHPLGGGRIFHVTLSDLRLRHPQLPGGLMTRLDHAPVTAQTLERSAMTFIGMREPDPAFRKGYSEWKQAFEEGRAGSFGVSIATVLEIFERRLNGIPLDQP